MRVIGDVHEKFGQYLKLAGGAKFSLQLGDLGFDYLSLDKLDPACHKFFGGNHDNYYVYHNLKYSLGDYGMCKLNDLSFFFMRGAFSIDKEARLKYEQITRQKIWWPEEELSYAELNDACDMYRDLKPDLVITHTCPRIVAERIGNPDVLRAFGFDPATFKERTSQALDVMFEYHRPKRWIFGHFHKSWQDTINGCHFQCLKELEYIDI